MRKKKFTIDRTPERVELMAMMASDNVAEASAAQTALAGFLVPLVQRLIDQKSTVAEIFTRMSLPKGAPLSIPVDPYADYREGDFHVWSTTKAGGLITQTVEGLSEYPFMYFPLDSALYLERDYVEQSRLDLMARAINRVVQEFLAKEERLGWTVILQALAAGTNTNGQNHTISATTAGRFQPDDINRLRVLVTRLYQSFASGSIAGDYGLTDLYLSPERMADIRALAYNPVNTIAIPNTDESTVMALPDSVRTEIFNASGLSVFQGLTLHELRELGLSRKLNTIFKAVTTNTPSYTPATQDLVIGMDLSQDNFISPVKTDGNGNTVSVSVDSQFVYNRAPKLGWVFSKQEAYIAVDNRQIVGMII